MRRVKNDERDARDLADLLRLGRLAEAWIAPPAVREARELVRYRARLVQLDARPGTAVAADCRTMGHRSLRSPRVPLLGWQQMDCIRVRRRNPVARSTDQLTAGHASRPKPRSPSMPPAQTDCPIRPAYASEPSGSYGRRNSRCLISRNGTTR
jgi:hypothetical protein